MDRREIVIHVRGGIVQEVFCADVAVDVIVVDWDCQSGDSIWPAVAHLTPQPLHLLAGSEIEAAIDAAAQAGLLSEPCACEPK